MVYGLPFRWGAIFIEQSLIFNFLYHSRKNFICQQKEGHERRKTRHQVSTCERQIANLHISLLMISTLLSVLMGYILQSSDSGYRIGIWNPWKHWLSVWQDRSAERGLYGKNERNLNPQSLLDILGKKMYPNCYPLGILRN